MNQDEVILGVDTHLDVHVGAVISITGKLLATLAIDTTASGYLELLNWARSLGTLQRVGVEGTATYGSGLTRVLRNNGIEVFEVNRPDRAARRLRGKTDPTDAESAACAVLSARATAVPKEQSGAAYAMRAVSVGRAGCPAYVAPRGAKLRQRHQQHALRGLHGGEGVQGLDFLRSNGVHGLAPIGERKRTRKKEETREGTEGPRPSSGIRL